MASFGGNKIFSHEILTSCKTQNLKTDRDTGREKESDRDKENENKSQWVEGEREIAAEGWLIQNVKLMYDRTDWCCLSDTSELNVVRRRQITAASVLHPASRTKRRRVYFQMRERETECVCVSMRAFSLTTLHAGPRIHISVHLTLYSKQPDKTVYCSFLKAKSYRCQSQACGLWQQLY